MFTIRDIVDIAVKIERNGAETYRGAAARTKDDGLASLLEWLADQEQEHARWFTALRECVRDPSGRVDDPLAQMGREMLENVVGDSSLGLDEIDFEAIQSVEELLQTAVDLEGNTILFYDMLGGFLQDDTSKVHLEMIIEEERKHAKLLLEFIDTGSVSVEDRPT